MKRSLITLALVAVAGTAGAQTVTPPSAGGATVTPPSVGSGTVTTPPASPGSVTTPSVTPPAASAPSVSVPNVANAPPLPNAEGSAAAQARITADGYSNVQGLVRQPDGSWTGKAMRGGAMVDVTVDASGNVVTK